MRPLARLCQAPALGSFAQIWDAHEPAATLSSSIMLQAVRQLRSKEEGPSAAQQGRGPSSPAGRGNAACPICCPRPSLGPCTGLPGRPPLVACHGSQENKSMFHGVQPTSQSELQSSRGQFCHQQTCNPHASRNIRSLACTSGDSKLWRMQDLPRWLQEEAIAADTCGDARMPQVGAA